MVSTARASIAAVAAIFMICWTYPRREPAAMVAAG